MKLAGGMNMMMCLLDVIFNFFFIFPGTTLDVAGVSLYVPGLGLGVLGAALGTVCAEIVTASAVMWLACTRRPELALVGRHCDGLKTSWKDFIPTGKILSNALRISAPMTLEHGVICGAQIMVTVIVAPLGVLAIAANSFAVTAEALCYMPGYGIADAATTLVGQSFGAGRRELARQFGYITVGLGMTVMTIMGAIMWIFAPDVMGLFTPVEESWILALMPCGLRPGRTYVRRLDSGLWSDGGSRGYNGACSHEFFEYLAC